MPPFLSDALVLRTYAMGESSRVVVLLTRERGKLRAVAKGARGPKSRFLATLEPFSEVRVGLYGRQGAELYRLGECELIRTAFRSGDLDASLALSYFAELFDAFAQEGEKDDAVYRLAVAVVAALVEGRQSRMVLTRYLEAWLLKLNGVYPSIDRCARCATRLAAAALRYDAPARGFVCEACGAVSGPLLSSGVRSFLCRVFKQSPGDLEASLVAADAQALENFQQTLAEHHMERSLRSLRVIRDVARGLR